MIEIGGSFLAAKIGCGTDNLLSCARAICSMYSTIFAKLIVVSTFSKEKSAS